MRKGILNSLAIGVLMLLTNANTSGRDSIPEPKINRSDVIKEVAHVLTRKQMDSIYSAYKVYPRLETHFKKLTDHIDSLNEEAVTFRLKADIASRQRDSLTHVYLLMSLENDRLREENSNYSKDFRIMTMAPHLIMIFVITFAASLMAQGAYDKYRKYEHK